MNWPARLAEILTDARRRREQHQAYRAYLAARRRRGLALRHAAKEQRAKERQP